MSGVNKYNQLVYKNKDAWNSLLNFISDSKPSKVYVITDENTLKHCLPHFLKRTNFINHPNIITIPAGEENKNISTCLDVWNNLSKTGADRNSLLINLGGGVVTDLGGFVASTFKRGLNFVNIPTSLLAMVDASIGGKNGVDLGPIKNQIGVIKLPEMVITDTEFLSTLPSNQINSGIAEMFKHGIIRSKRDWNRVKNIDINNTNDFEALLWESIAIKEAVVSQDPYEKNLRKTLNYGHTLGHAIESYFLENSEKKTLLHGEAIAIGIILATHISQETFNFPEDTLKDISYSIINLFPKVDFTQNDIENIIKLLVFDKKNLNGQVLFVLLEDIGIYKTNCIVANNLIYKAFDYYKNL